MVTAGKPSIDFIDAYQKAGHRSTFYMLSVTNNTQLVQALGDRARGIVISQVLPSPWNQSIAVVTPTRAGLVRALEETRRLDLGGYVIELSPTKHNSGTFVDLMILDASGRFRT
jgi:branched-chain amino acid transport system substrate-binding protein